MKETGSQPSIRAVREEKLREWRRQGSAFPNDFKRQDLAHTLIVQYSHQPVDQLKSIHVELAGRIVLKRLMGKASFLHLQDMSGRIQLYGREQDIGSAGYAALVDWDLGDIIGVSGYLFKTKTGELSVYLEKARLLSKSLRPLPEKFHGLHDTETRYRQRYLDLIVNPASREVFKRRSQLIVALRQFLYERGFMEVETPMMQSLAGGAAARPFMTHHHALNCDLYLRIAPELYLKRLVVGGFEKVFEINRNFRNEGVSTQHNPEFTMLEFYQAYATHDDLMDLTEHLFLYLAQTVLGQTFIDYQGHRFDLSKGFQRLSLLASIVQYCHGASLAKLMDLTAIRALASDVGVECQEKDSIGHIQLAIFEAHVEQKLIQPTFITAYPIEVSPLSRRNTEQPHLADRFELFVAGKEIANGFSELNDPEDQADRLRQQALEKAGGNPEAMAYDQDYITALEYGLPPTAGEGIGVDRLAMLFCDAPSIRDVLLFPQMKKAME